LTKSCCAQFKTRLNPCFCPCDVFGEVKEYLLAHGGSAALAEVGTLGLGIGDTLGEDGSILVSSILCTLSIAALESEAVTLVLKTLGSNQTLDLWCLGVWLLSLALGLNLTTDDELADIVFLGETKESADLGGALRTETLGVNDIGETWDIAVALLDDGEGKNRQIHSDDAATDRLALALTSSAGAVAGVAIGEQKADTSWVHDTLLHGETLLVVAAGDLEDVSLEFIANRVAWNLSAHSLLHEDSQLALILNLNQLLAAIGRVGDVELHLWWIVRCSVV